MLTSATRQTRRAIAATLLLAAALFTLIPTARPAAAPTPGATPLLSGFFVYATSNAQQANQMLDEIAATGASTIITFGTRVRPAALTNGRPDTDGFGECTINGQGCVTEAAAGRPVQAVFTYTEGASWNTSALECPPVPVESGQKRYSIFFLPTSGAGCTGAEYNAIVTLDASTASASKTGLLIQGTANRGMRMFAGMPAPVAQTGANTWLPDTSYLGVLDQFTRIWLANLASYPGAPALAGVYHHTEMALSTSPSWDPVLATYRIQNAAVAAVRPDLATLVSPYIDARRSAAARTPLASVRAAVARLADTAAGTSMIIAPQDGQGTGKVGAFSADMRAQQVDQPSVPVAGAGTFADRYLGSTGDYMREVVAGAGQRAQVWVNVEMMTATTTGAQACEGATSGRGRTDIDRVRRQVGVASVPGVQQVIGFMWTPYATCGGPSSLAAALREFPSPTHTAQATPSPAVPAPAAPAAKTPKVPLQTPSAQDVALVTAVQQGLTEMGYPEVGPVDGQPGPSTRTAVTLFQQDTNRPVTGDVDEVSASQIDESLTAGWRRPVPEVAAEPTATDPPPVAAIPTPQPTLMPRPHAPPRVEVGQATASPEGPLAVAAVTVALCSTVILTRIARRRAHAR